MSVTIVARNMNHTVRIVGRIAYENAVAVIIDTNDDRKVVLAKRQIVSVRLSA